MNKNTGLIIGVIILVVMGGIYVTSQSKHTVTMDAEMENTASMNDGETTMTNVGMKKDGAHIMAGSYEVYAPEKVMRAETEDVVLSFHASWCPSCRALDTDILKNIKTIPAGVSILKVDYDTATELKKKYGVTVQNTLVQIDAQGMPINKWSGSTELKSLLSHIK